MQQEYYSISTPSGNRFYAQVWHQYPNVDKVYFGGRRRCVCFSVYLPDEDEEEPEAPNLDSVGYDENCNVSGDLLKGSGTRLMLTAAFAFLRRLYGRLADTVVLVDKSQIVCQRWSMRLSVYYTLHHGQTWYQRTFGARPVKIDRANAFRTAMAEWNRTKRTKPSPSSLFAGVRSRKRAETLKTEYERHDHLGSFLRALKPHDCMVYKGWADDLIDALVPYLYGMQWEIPVSELELPDVDVMHAGNIKPPDMFVHTGGMSF